MNSRRDVVSRTGYWCRVVLGDPDYDGAILGPHERPPASHNVASGTDVGGEPACWAHLVDEPEGSFWEVTDV